MSIAILIPTYSNHIPLNIRFINSVMENCQDDGIPNIFFATSSRAEAEELALHFKEYDESVRCKLHAFDVESSVEEYNTYLSIAQYDSDATVFFRDGRCGLINLKKLSGVDHVFSLGFENVVVLDSEILLFRESDLLRSLEKLVIDDVYRYSLAAYNHEIMTKIQNDSIRSVSWSFDSRDHFARSYGWYENLCIYNKDKFYKFLGHLTKDCDSFTDKFVLAASRFRGASFEWISYMAYRIYILNENIKMLCVDELIEGKINGHPWSTPQNENLYQYLTGEEEKDSLFLLSVNPPWVPYTENTYTIGLLNKYLPDSCCLMFHLDRKHPGADPEAKLDVVEVDAVQEQPVSLEPIIKRRSLISSAKKVIRKFI